MFGSRQHIHLDVVADDDDDDDDDNVYELQCINQITSLFTYFLYDYI